MGLHAGVGTIVGDKIIISRTDGLFGDLAT
jgi:hypothetical protein